MDQRTEEWFAMRAGKFTGSRFNHVMARIGPKNNQKPAASYWNLLTELAVERVLGTCVPIYTNAAMQRGIDLEPVAREAYENDQMVAVVEEGFITHPEYDFIGVSPDGLVGDDGLVEIKCPSAMDKHYRALMDGDHAEEYKWQIQGQIWCAGRDWCDAVSFDDRWPEELRLAIKRVERDEKMIKELEAACVEAHEIVKQRVQALLDLKAAA